MLRVIREIAFLGATHNFQIWAVHLPGIQNRIADRLSREHIEGPVDLYGLVKKDWTRVEVKKALFSVVDNW